MRAQFLMWLFVWGVSVLDVGFAWLHRHTFSQWEMNPVVAALVSHCGLVAALGFRLLSVGGGFVVICLAKQHLRSLATKFVFTVHLGLLLVYSPLLIG